MKTRINQIHKQLDRLERDFIFNSNRMKELSNENRRGSSEYWRLHEECKRINDQIRDLLNELWKIEEA